MNTRSIPNGLMLVALLGTPIAATPVQWAVTDGGNGHWYEDVYVFGGITWHAINPDPQAEGWYLATMTSEAENSFIYNLIADDARFWIADGQNASGPWLGGFQPAGSAEPTVGWRWVTDEPFIYANWATGEPNDRPPGEDCLHLFARGASSAATWNDLPGSYPLNGFIRELPEPSSALLLVAGMVGLRHRGRWACP